MQEEHKKKSLMLLVIGVLVLLIIIAGATYAFFIAQMGAGQAFEINAQAASNDSLIFLMEDVDVKDESKKIVDNHNKEEDVANTEIKIEANQQNFIENGNSIGDGVKATATLTANSTTNSAEADYYVYVNIESNELKYSSYKKEGVEQPLVFKTEEEKTEDKIQDYTPVPELIMIVKNDEGVYKEPIGELTNKSVTINGEKVEGYDITEKSGLIKIAKSTLTVIPPEGEVSGLQSTTENWEIEIVLVNLTTDQELNTGKQVTGEVIIQKEEYVLENGTEQFPYLIESIEDLVRLSNEVNDGDNKAGMTYVLTKDLDFQDPTSYEDDNGTTFGDINGNSQDEPLITELTTGSGFRPIGRRLGTMFEGNFEGKYNNTNHIIKNLYIENSKLVNDDIGLFGTIRNSKISNLTVTGKIHTIVTSNTGGIVGSSYNSTVENVQFGDASEESSVSSDTNGYNAGGIIGCVYDNTNIYNAINYSQVSNGANVGEIIGVIDLNITVNIEDSHNYGNVRNEKSNNIGGIIGRNRGTLLLTNTSNEANVTANIANSHLYMAGFVGRNDGSVTIDSSYNTGEVINETKTYEITETTTNFNLSLGGLIGVNASNENTVKITNSYNTGNVTNGMRMGGIIGYSSGDSKIVLLDKVYNTGNITNIDQTWANGFNIGGLIGYSNGSEAYILNSYNIHKTNTEDGGNISGIKSIGGGLIGMSNKIGVIVNSYNLGNVSKTTGISVGIMAFAGTSYINNVYNGGNIKGSADNSLGISYYEKVDPNIYNIDHAYYLDNVDFAVNTISINATQMTEQDMKNQTFVDTLNSNIASAEADMKEKYPILNDYILSRWKLGSDGYPTLINE